MKLKLNQMVIWIDYTNLKYKYYIYLINLFIKFSFEESAFSFTNL